jgi:hypothetical protein
MWVRRQPRLIAQLVPEILQMLFREAALKEGASVNARRSVALKVDQVAWLIAILSVKEMMEPDFN